MTNKIEKIRIIFIGTPEFAVPGLESLIEDDDFEILGVISQEDKKIGRKQLLSESAVKVLAKKNNLKVLQPKKIREVCDDIKNLNPDFIVVIAYGQIIPKNILDIPRYGCINVHGSLLPKYRGASCVQAAILNMDEETGVTIMKMDEGLDTGPIIFQEKIKLHKSETAESLSKKLSLLSKDILPRSLKLYLNGELTEKVQDDTIASYVPLLKKEDGLIEWNQSAEKVDAFVRAMTFWPGAFTFLDDQKVKIIECGEIKKFQNEVASIFRDNSKLFVHCKDKAIEIKLLQLAGKKVISAHEFLQGYSRFIGKVLKYTPSLNKP